MEYRPLGKTGLRVSTLGFGCGNVGGLMVRGTPADRERAVARGIELGINYFDTAPAYGNGVSERHLGQALSALKANVYVGTKFRLTAPDTRDLRSAIVQSLDASLQRLGLERVDLLQLHNRIGSQRSADADMLSVEDVLQEVVPTLQSLQQQGKIRFYGITALGETAALHQVIDAGVLDTAQVCYNLLNPSAGTPVPAGFPAPDFDRLLAHTHAQNMGAINIRVLAAGALSGSAARHPVAVPTVAPIASGPDYATDVQHAQELQSLVQEGHVQDLVEASLRFAVSNAMLSTILLGYSSLEHLEQAAEYMARGPLPAAALDRLARLWQQLARTAPTH
jgi:aryl-alcohol dehydrogenase-like predicted oxidoreductase